MALNHRQLFSLGSGGQRLKARCPTLPVSSSFWWRPHLWHSLACGHITPSLPLLHMAFFCVSGPPLSSPRRDSLVGFRATPIHHDLTLILTLIISAKIPFPNKVTFIVSRGQDLVIISSPAPITYGCWDTSAMTSLLLLSKEVVDRDQ